MFDEIYRAEWFRNAWNSVQIARPVHYTLFTFGESELPYFLVTAPEKPGELTSIVRGEIRITRPTIITPDNMAPEFQNFFDDPDDEATIQFLMARTAAFSHLKLTNGYGVARTVSDSVQETVARLARQLDDEEEDRIAILTAPKQLAGMAMFKYAADRIQQSAPGNLQELRERGFLP